MDELINVKLTKKKIQILNIWLDILPAGYLAGNPVSDFFKKPYIRYPAFLVYGTSLVGIKTNS